MKVIPNASLKAYNTFGIESHCAYLSKIEKPEDILATLQKVSPNKLFVLGGGSNILLPDYLESWVMTIEMDEVEVLDDKEDYVKVRVGAGLNWHEFVILALDNGWGGVENLSLIPGKVGAAPIQNIGAYGVEIEQYVDHVHYVDLFEKESHTLKAEDCAFSYRDSIFKGELKGRVAITAVDFVLPKQGSYTLNTSYGAIQDQLAEWDISEPHAKDVSKAVIHIRQSKLPDPAEIGNAGSFFKNPILSKEEFENLQQQIDQVVHYPMGNEQYKVPAGWLIDQCGWKGKHIGAVGCYEKQALVIVNLDGATSSDIRAFAEKVQESVIERFGIELEREVNYIS